MAPEEKYYETGADPYYLNMDTTNREYSKNDLTAPEFGLLEVMSNHYLIIENSIEFKTLNTESTISTGTTLQFPTRLQDI